MVLTRMRMAAVVAAGVLTLVVGFPANAQDQTISGFQLGGDGRAWQFTNSPFGLSEGSVALPGRVATDAFDATALEFNLNNGGGASSTSYTDPDGHADYDAKTNSISLTPVASTNGLLVSRVETASGPYLRSLVRIDNPTGSSQSVIARWSSQLGSDGAESTQSSSSGDKAFSNKDRWVVSSETGADDYNDDPVIGFALWGKGVNTKALDFIALQGPGTGALTVFYDVTIPAGATRYMLFYTEMHSSPATAKSSMHKYDSTHLSSSLLKGIPTSVRSKVLNWHL